ncbi:MAG TPA: CARDB domain-containing protein [Solirubrobacterales bacterium]|nr:CARDB domain-containing protein [Solirubrobacterales bacterium]
MLRRGLALGGALVVLIVIVLGVKGCLDARAERALSDYGRNVSQILKETEQTSSGFFKSLEDPGGLTVTEFTEQVKADASAVKTQASRVDGLSAPGEMGNAQQSLELVYQLRSSAMEKIASKMSSALADTGVAAKAIAAITRQMGTLFSSDVVYEEVVRPEINGVFEDKGIDGSDVPASTFVPEGTKWLEESTVSGALGAISGATGTTTEGVHGLGLSATSVNGTELVEGGEAIVTAEEAFEVEVQVQNQGESTENGITVEVSYNGGNTTSGTIEAIEPGEIGSTVISLTPVPTGTVTLEVNVPTVPGEELSTNNEATYTVTVG